MSELKQMYELLEQMVENARMNDRDKVFELKKQYEALIPKVYHSPPTKLNLGYDNCKQSCVMLFVMPYMQKKFIEDAQKRFARIPKPLE